MNDVKETMASVSPVDRPNKKRKLNGNGSAVGGEYEDDEVEE